LITIIDQYSRPATWFQAVTSGNDIGDKKKAPDCFGVLAVPRQVNSTGGSAQDAIIIHSDATGGRIHVPPEQDAYGQLDDWFNMILDPPANMEPEWSPSPSPPKQQPIPPYTIRDRATLSHTLEIRTQAMSHPNCVHAAVGIDCDCSFEAYEIDEIKLLKQLTTKNWKLPHYIFGFYDSKLSMMLNIQVVQCHHFTITSIEEHVLWNRDNIILLQPVITHHEVYEVILHIIRNTEQRWIRRCRVHGCLDGFDTVTDYEMPHFKAQLVDRLDFDIAIRHGI
jgi:hypothetical protein